MRHAPSMGYAELFRRSEFRTPTQAFNALVTAKRMFKRRLQRVIAEYAADDRAVAEELAGLRCLLQRFG